MVNRMTIHLCVSVVCCYHTPQAHTIPHHKYVFFPQEWTQIHDQCHTSSDDHDINMESHPPPPRCVGEVSSSDFTSPRNSSVVPASLSFQSDSTGPWSQEQVHCGLQVLTDITLPSPCTEHDEYDSQVVRAVCVFFLPIQL